MINGMHIAKTMNCIKCNNEGDKMGTEPTNLINLILSSSVSTNRQVSQRNITDKSGIKSLPSSRPNTTNTKIISRFIL